jgi:hypothetical protein
MPVVFRLDGIRFFFFSNEGDPREPLHIHARTARADAKLWLYPDVRVAYSRGFNGPTLARITQAVAERRELIERAWHDHFG